jgi:DNA (cytosine-5)-methyltransferase 1
VYIVGRQTRVERKAEDVIYREGVLARGLPVDPSPALLGLHSYFELNGDLADVSESFGAKQGTTPFRNAGFMSRRRVWTLDLTPRHEGPKQTLADVLDPPELVPDAYYIPATQVAVWEYLKGAKREQRVHKGSGTPYFYVEGPIPFPDPTDRPSRTILTGEGGTTASRFKHVIQTPDGRYRRLTPRELERLNGFPDDWTATGMSDGRRAFMMGNALVVGIVERIGAELIKEIEATQTDRQAVAS